MRAPLLRGTGLALLLAGLCACHVDGDPADAVETAEGECAGIPMARALPTADAIAGKPLAWRQCSSAEVVAFYGAEDTGCQIQIADLQAANPPGSEALGAAAMFEHARAASMAVARTTVETVIASRDTMESDPQILAVFGGPAHLPVVGQAATGDPYVVAVPSAQTGPVEQPLVSVLRNRYSLRIECPAPVGTHDEATALYAPWLAATRLGQLP